MRWRPRRSSRRSTSCWRTRDGILWAQRFTADLLTREPPSWDVFDPAGTWLGVVATPGGMTVTSIRDGLVAGVYRDELGVEYVSVHRLAMDAR